MTIKTWNQHTVKKHNKSLVLKTIKEHFQISRASIAEYTGLNKGTVSSLVNELIKEDLIYESGPGESSGGRRPVMLHFNKLAGYAIGIDLGVNYILGIVTDLNGNICHEKFVKYDHSANKDMKEQLFYIIEKLINLTPKSTYGIIGIGIGVPGTVDSNGKILLAPNLKWRNVFLKELLQEKYNIPVIIENEANAGAYGEKRFGIGRDKNHIIYVSIGIGIGVGLLLNGRLYKGKNGFAGELGHMAIETNGKKCRCGSSGCWELYASEQALDNYAKDFNITDSSDEHISLEKLIELSNTGHSKSIMLFDKVGNKIGIGLNNIVNIFNPEQIIIGGRISAAKPWLEDAITRQITQTLWYQQKDLQVDFSKLETYSAAVGVAAFTTEAFIQDYLKTI